MMDKKQKIEVEANIKDTPFDRRMLLRCLFSVNTGLPVSWLYPPTNVIQAAKLMVAISAATTINSDDIFLVHSTPLATSSL